VIAINTRRVAVNVRDGCGKRARSVFGLRVAPSAGMLAKIKGRTRDRPKSVPVFLGS
jgi:hypothetical protein